MSKDNHIEEMAKATMKHCKIDNQCGSCHWSTCNECLAEVLYNVGFRKQSEVAREIFEEIERKVASKIPMKFTPIFKRDLSYDAGVIDGKHDAFYEVLVLIAELKKKYTEV